MLHPYSGLIREGLGCCGLDGGLDQEHSKVGESKQWERAARRTRVQMTSTLKMVAECSTENSGIKLEDVRSKNQEGCNRNSYSRRNPKSYTCKIFYLYNEIGKSNK